MKRIGITQRVDIIESYGERRDALDQQWYDLVMQLNAIPIPLPNIHSELVPTLLHELNLDAVIFTGGNNLTYLDPTSRDCAPERDAFELTLISELEKNDIPFLGVCRGMQIINHYYSGSLIAIKNHVATRHKIYGVEDSFKFASHVNSFHNWAIPHEGLANELNAIALDENNNVEALIHKTKKIAGMMWHPERESDTDATDLNFIKEILL
ncbi:gamma-glutamyl-gamma-aminobutyrate hydrolase family protein [Vibrio sp. HN007]|uniref:gamma-glutamyl-gamma-aminobutyrate hydrolase family protein n=1 Tax=Vibrio iocasae TaxID=3098914 RepID=UPI0035D3DEFB